MKILIKLSGESLSGGQNGVHYDEPTLSLIAAKIAALLTQGLHIALVIGGGNLFRGSELTGKLSIERPTADYIGMLATVQNALVLRDYFLSKGIETRVCSAIAMPQICEAYIPKRAKRHLEKGRVVIFAAGLGAPFFTTDSSAVQRALELHVDILVFAKNGTDGLYSADPKTHKDARLLKEETATRVLEQGLRIADTAAIALAKEHELPIKIIQIGDIDRSLDERVGSVIHPR